MIRFCNLIIQEIDYLPLLYANKNEIKSRMATIRNLFNYNDTVFVSFFRNSDALSKHIGCNIPKWVKGVSYKNCIFLIKKEGWISEFEDCILDILIHEYIHVSVANTFSALCPLWLNEGFATILSNQYLKLDTSVCINEYLYYSQDYSDDRFYLQSSYIVQKLFKQYGTEFIVNHAQKCKNFLNDSILGIANLN